jgi:hypothetical protein
MECPPSNFATIGFKRHRAIEIGPKALCSCRPVAFFDFCVRKVETVAPPDAEDHEARPGLADEGNRGGRAGAMVWRFDDGDRSRLQKFFRRCFNIAREQERDAAVGDAQHDAPIVDVLEENPIGRRPENIDPRFAELEDRMFGLHFFYQGSLGSLDDLTN